MASYPKLEVKNNVLKNGYHLLTSDYKTRNAKRKTHNGMDFIGKSNSLDYIVAVDKGTVYSVSNNSSSGYYVIIEHENTLRSFYAHLKKGSITVKKGDKVSKGQVIGYMGATGNANGAHLHFGVRTSNTEHLDPLPYLTGEKTFDQTKDSISKYPKGTYEIVSPRYVRNGPGTEYAIKKVSQLSADGKKNATSTNLNAPAQYKKGTRFTAQDVVYAKNKGIWAKTPSGYVCLESCKGTTYVKKG